MLTVLFISGRWDLWKFFIFLPISDNKHIFEIRKSQKKIIHFKYYILNAKERTVNENCKDFKHWRNPGYYSLDFKGI